MIRLVWSEWLPFALIQEFESLASMLNGRVIQPGPDGVLMSTSTEVREPNAIWSGGTKRDKKWFGLGQQVLETCCDLASTEERLIIQGGLAFKMDAWAMFLVRAVNRIFGISLGCYASRRRPPFVNRSCDGRLRSAPHAGLQAESENESPRRGNRIVRGEYIRSMGHERSDVGVGTHALDTRSTPEGVQSLSRSATAP